MEEEVKMENKNVEIEAVAKAEILFDVIMSMRFANYSYCGNIRMIKIMPNDIDVKELTITMQFKDECAFNKLVEKLCEFEIFVFPIKENKYLFYRKF